MYYFVSDTHLGLGGREESRRREGLLVEWLREAAKDAEAIFLVGDIFDFWFEYRRVVPKGFVRLLATLAELTERGVAVHFFGGNHDMWTRDYLAQECGVVVHDICETFELAGWRVFVSHGDDISARRSGWGTRLMNAIFRSRVLRWMFSWFVHPDVAMWFGGAWSSTNRKEKAVSHTFYADRDPMVRFARDYSEKHPDVDYFVFGHNHCAEIYPVSERATCVFLGEWIQNPHYATLDTNGAELHKLGIRNYELINR